MPSIYLDRYLIFIIICFGVFFRLAVFWASPVNNSYDDHLEVINIYSEDYKRPTPFNCWECYQPPLYYYVASLVFNVSENLGCNKSVSWKIVQFINPFLSFLVIIIAVKILVLLKLSTSSIFITLSFIVSLPVDILTSAMIGNDYMLVFFSVLSFYFFLKTTSALKSNFQFRFWFIFLILSATLGSLTKQHGLLIHLFPIAVLLIYRKLIVKKYFLAIPFYLFAILFSITDELWKYAQTGQLLISNQDHFDYAKQQFPGSLEKIEFFTFRIIELFQHPFISNFTSASFFTEIFAKTFYDYEWRFISPQIPFASIVAISGGSLGLIWFSYIIFSVVKFTYLVRSKKIDLQFHSFSPKALTFILTLLFWLVPLIQTLRFPFFSSMKSMFMLPGIILFLIIFGTCIKNDAVSKKIGYLVCILNIAYGLLLVVSILLFLNISVNHLHGPLWPIP